jgi:hypothetical protein
MNLRDVAERSDWLDGLEVGALDPSSMEEAIGVLARGMRENPIHVAAFGQDPERRQRSLRRFFGAAFTVISLHEHMIVARSEDGRVVGVLGMMPPGACRVPFSICALCPRCCATDLAPPGV